ncbi:hypothetical protein BC670_2289 [Flavobacterium branchiophilum]|uniref:Uncharacterized protein n=1 Tax=Flavobacterium branchiophilum TaxID=55197 RepID=A0A543G5J2_9FLAO|nr:hypothetical protein BC670_2289 [Flavobacterium branchiophilum]
MIIASFYVINTKNSEAFFKPQILFLLINSDVLFTEKIIYSDRKNFNFFLKLKN